MRHEASGEEGWGQFVDIERAQASKQKRRQQQEEEVKNSEGIEEEEDAEEEERQQTAATALKLESRDVTGLAMLTLIGGSRHGNNRSGA